MVYGRASCRFGIELSLAWLAIVLFALPSPPLWAQTDGMEKIRCVALELYVRSSDSSTTELVDTLKGYLSSKTGIQLKVFDVDSDSKGTTRLKSISEAYKLTEPKLPLAYGLNKYVLDQPDEVTWKRRLDELLRMEVFARTGCSRCARAKEYLPKFQKKYPGIQIEIYDVITDPKSNQRYSELGAGLHAGGISFPGFWICKQLVVGFESESLIANRLDGILKRWTFECNPKPPLSHKSSFEPLLGGSGPYVIRPWGPLFSSSSPWLVKWQQESKGHNQEDVDSAFQLPIGNEPEKLPIGSETDEEVEVPVLGRLSAKHLGMPLFTILIGLVDGFNPCAMWVLLFLLSVLINLRDRWKILSVAGTFVFISGAAYYAFMAAWLNVLMFVGFLRWVQILLATLAIFVGLVNIKDFFAWKKGLSLSIPESAKPGIYSRIRSIVMAESLVSAILGATVLAVLVNFIELLCTAGLPALYSQVLTLQGYPPWKNYAYLLLYILAYMLDDSLMVAIVVITLGKRKLQENEGKWLKLFSGLVILVLGLVLLFRPDWLE